MASKCRPWKHQWSKWKVVEYTVYPNQHPLRSYSGPAEALNDTIKVSRNERICTSCGLTQTRSL